MSEQNLKKFLKKVKDLNELVSSLDAFPNRRSQLRCCKSHKEVIELAMSWGFDIGKRWGE